MTERKEGEYLVLTTRIARRTATLMAAALPLGLAASFTVPAVTGKTVAHADVCVGVPGGVESTTTDCGVTTDVVQVNVCDGTSSGTFLAPGVYTGQNGWFGVSEGPVSVVGNPTNASGPEGQVEVANFGVASQQTGCG